MDKITAVEITKLKESKYIFPLMMKYIQDGVTKLWEFIATHESVAIIIFNIDTKKLLFVKQFRPAVYYNTAPKNSFINDQETLNPSIHPAENGVTLELCAGIVDSTKDHKLTAKTEVIEECGYDVPLNSLERVISHRGGVGTTGQKQTLFFCEVNDSMKVNKGGGCASEGEMIEVIELSIEEAKNYISQPDVLSPSGLLFGIMWFIQNKAHKYT